MADVSGFVQGMHYATQDSQTRQQMAQTAMEEPLRIEKAQIENKSAQTALESQQKMLKMMSAMGQGGQVTPAGAADSMADSMDALGKMALASGLPEQAKEYANTASTIRKNQSTIEENQQKILVRNADLTGRLMEGVHDQQSFDRAQQMYTAVTGQPSRFAGQRYTPELADQIRQLATSIKDRAQIKSAEARTKESAARTREAETRIPLIRAQTREAEARDAKLRKSGATDQIPKAAEIRAITDLMNKEFDISPEEQAGARVTARPLAERMKELMADNPALKQSAAARRAYQEAKNRGDFGGLTKLKDRPGESASVAQPLPQNKAKLKDNKWYVVQGQPRLLMDGQFYTPDELEAQGIGSSDDNESDSESDDDNEPAKED